MPELPEVETTKNGITPYLFNQTIDSIDIREYQLRWPIDQNLNTYIANTVITDIKRRGKYILIELNRDGGLLIHLGMSGSVRILNDVVAPSKHDHFDLELKNGVKLRYHDPRKFGSLLFTQHDLAAHPRLLHLGVEPLSSDFTAQYCFQHSRSRTKSIKTFIMDSNIVVGVGNIYAAESLFLARIHPTRSCNRISLLRYTSLVKSIIKVLESAIKAGGTTLKDFSKIDGSPGYFTQELYVYGRENKPCFVCERPIKRIQIGQRSTYYCSNCQH